MGKVVVINHVTLDGVMQGPGHPDEDTRDGFAHGGWAFPRGDDAIVAKARERLGGDRAFLFGRRTYEQLLASWNAQGGPLKDALNNTQKYVASHSPATRLEWPNSTLLERTNWIGTRTMRIPSVVRGRLLHSRSARPHALPCYRSVSGTGGRIPARR